MISIIKYLSSLIVVIVPIFVVLLGKYQNWSLIQELTQIILIAGFAVPITTLGYLPSYSDDQNSEQSRSLLTSHIRARIFCVLPLVGCFATFLNPVFGTAFIYVILMTMATVKNIEISMQKKPFRGLLYISSLKIFAIGFSYIILSIYNDVTILVIFMCLLGYGISRFRNQIKITSNLKIGTVNDLYVTILSNFDQMMAAVILNEYTNYYLLSRIKIISIMVMTFIRNKALAIQISSYIHMYRSLYREIFLALLMFATATILYITFVGFETNITLLIYTFVISLTIFIGPIGVYIMRTSKTEDWTRYLARSSIVYLILIILMVSKYLAIDLIMLPALGSALLIVTAVWTVSRNLNDV